MPRHWFTNYKGVYWDPCNGYNSNFQIQINALRARFALTKTEQPGIEQSQTWVPYITHDEQKLEVLLACLDWKNRGVWKYGSESCVSPLLKARLKVRIHLSEWQEIFDGEFQVTFQADFPNGKLGQDRPQIHVKGWKGSWLRNTDQLCVMGDAGDWNPKKDNIVRTIEVAAHWVVDNFLSSSLRREEASEQTPQG